MKTQRPPKGFTKSQDEQKDFIKSEKVQGWQKQLTNRPDETKEREKENKEAAAAEFLFLRSDKQRERRNRKRNKKGRLEDRETEQRRMLKIKSVTTPAQKELGRVF